MRVVTALLTASLAGSLLAGCDDDLSERQSEGLSLAGLAGRWTGNLSQEGLPPFQVTVILAGNGKGSVAYTGIRCAGTWRMGHIVVAQRGAAGHPPDKAALVSPFFQFTEVITEGVGGECKGKGTVQLTPPPEERIEELDYEFNGGGVTSVGVLKRASKAELEAVFKQAGIRNPASTFTEKPTRD